MKKLQCELCQSVDIVKTAEGLFECQHCGCKYTAEQARSLISGTVEVVLGNAEMERQLSNAEAQRKIGEYAASFSSYEKLQHDFAADYRCWWGWLETCFAYYRSKKYIPYVEEIRKMQETLKKVFMLEKDEALVHSFKRGWMAFWENAAKGLIDGQYTLGEWMYRGDTCPVEKELKRLNDDISYYKMLSPGMADAMQRGMDAAEAMRREQLGYDDVEVGIFHGRHSHRFVLEKYHLRWYIVPGGCIHFALGKHIVGEWTDSEGFNKHMGYRLSPESVTPFEGERRARILSQAQAYVNARATQGYCAYCASDSLKKKLFDVRCSKCGRKW